MNYNRYGNPVRALTVGESAAYPFSTYSTIQEAIDNALPGDHISIYPGTYDEALTIPDTKRDLVFVGAGALDEITVAPSSGVPLDLSGARGIEFHNIGFECPSGDDFAVWVHESARRIGFYNCKAEGGDVAVVKIGGAVTDTAAPADIRWDDGDITWGVVGILFGASATEVPTQIYVNRGVVHNQTDAWVDLASNGDGRDVAFKDVDFLLGEDHTAPTVGIDTGVLYGSLVGGSIQLASNAGALGTHTNMKFRAVAFTDSFTTV